MPSTKVCVKCRQVKPLEAFGRHSGKTDGLHIRCKVCVNADAQRPEVRAQRKEYRRAYYTDHENYAAVHDAKVCNSYPNTRYADDQESRLSIYVQRRALGPGFEIDHVVPLAGSDIVKGLHVSWNMRIVTAAENGRKHNSFTHADALALTPANSALFVKSGLSVCC